MNKKALVLCGGIPQAALIEELKRRGICTILADINPNVVARPFADEFYPVSVLDIDAVRNLAIEKKVDMILTACADQVLLVQAQVSEELGLPCYIDYETANVVSSKALMKRVFEDNEIPSSKYVVMKDFDPDKTKSMRFPLIVKPVDSYSSRGVKKVNNIEELKTAYCSAKDISRTDTVIVEEYVEGEEITVDVYVEQGKAKILCISNIDKIPGNEKFVICRTRYPAQISAKTVRKVEEVAERIAKAFNLKDSPMLIQMITDGEEVSVVEFCARTGGGDKFRSIKNISGFDVIKAVVDLTFGYKPHVESFFFSDFIINEFLYTKQGIFSHLEGFKEMKEQGLINEYYQLKMKGAVCGNIESSSDRVAYYTIQAKSINEARVMARCVNNSIKAIDIHGNDILLHELIADF